MLDFRVIAQADPMFLPLHSTTFGILSLRGFFEKVAPFMR